MSFYANGIITASSFSNSIINPYDTTVYAEPDGSAWVRIVHHNNPASVRFASSDSFTTSVYKSADLWFNASLLNTNKSGKWELMIKQKETSSSSETKYRFVQTVNPMTATFDQTKNANITVNTSSGYSTNSAYGGVHKLGSNSYLVTNNSTNGNWYGALGCWTVWNGGLPGIFGRAITTGYIDFYYRIDGYTADKLSINAGGVISADFIEY